MIRKTPKEHRNKFGKNSVSCCSGICDNTAIIYHPRQIILQNRSLPKTMKQIRETEKNRTITEQPE